MMKSKLFTFLALMLLSHIVSGQNFEHKNDFLKDFSFEKNQSLSSYLKLQPQSFVIDTMDSVVFDLFNSTANGNQVMVPVSFNSDDFTYALDFSIKFNYPDVEFDTLIVTANGINYLYYFNPNDSTLRFTSYSLGQMTSNTTILMLHLNTMNGYACLNDLHTITGYLNGDKCSYKVTDCDTTSLSIDENAISSQKLLIYPNPGKDKITIQHEHISLIEILNTSGQIVLSMTVSLEKQNATIDLSSIKQGIYFVKTYSQENISVSKLLIRR